MTREAIIERTIITMNRLPDEKMLEISDFADFIIKRYEDILLTDEIQKLATNSQSFDFLNDEEEIYSMEDLKEKFNA